MFYALLHDLGWPWLGGGAVRETVVHRDISDNAPLGIERRWEASCDGECVRNVTRETSRTILRDRPVGS